MKGGSILCWRTVVGVVGSPSPGAALRPSASVGLWESRAQWPCSVGIWSERVEAVGAAGRTTWIAVVGLADETSERGRLCGVSLVRSSRRQPSTTACPGGDDLPQGRGAAPNCCVAERRSENLGACQRWKENHRGGSKLFGRKITQALTLRKEDTQEEGIGSIPLQGLCPLIKAVEEEMRTFPFVQGGVRSKGR
jgi:hypothetical protein